MYIWCFDRVYYTTLYIRVRVLYDLRLYIQRIYTRNGYTRVVKSAKPINTQDILRRRRTLEREAYKPISRQAKPSLCIKFHLRAGVVFGWFGPQNHPRHRIVVVEFPGAEKHEGGVV